MKLIRSFNLAAFVLVLVSIVGFCVAQDSTGLLLVAGVLAVMSWYLTEGPRGRSLPRWVSNVLTVAVAINVVVDFAQHLGDPMGVLGRFTVWLTLIKLYERKAVRDYSQLLALSLLLMLTGCLQSQDLVFGLLLLAYIVLGLYVLLLYQLYAGFERASFRQQSAVPGGYHLPPAFHPIIGRSPGLQFRALVMLVGLVGFVAGSFVFIVAPRDLPLGIFSSMAQRNQGRAAQLIDEINLTTGTRISESRELVATLQLLDRLNQPLRMTRQILLRYAVLERYEENPPRWVVNMSNDRSIAYSPPGYAPLMAPLEKGEETVSESLITQRITMSQRQERNLLSMAFPYAVAADEAADFTYNPTTQSVECLQGLASYSIQAVRNPSAETLRRLCDRRLPREPASTYGRYPKGTAVEALALKLLSDAGIEPEPPGDATTRFGWHERAAHVFQGHLRSGAYRYTIDLSDVVHQADDQRDPIERFLTDFKRGHCEYFAAALVALCHSVDVPARLVTGFAVDEYDETTQQYLIRQLNAHAWVEVQTGEYLWTTFDPTPSDPTRGTGAAGSLMDRLLSLYGLFEMNWNNRVVLYDGKMRSQLVGSLSDAWSRRLSELVDGTTRWAAEVNRQFDLGPAGYLWLGLVGFAMTLAVIALTGKVRRVLQLRRVLHLRQIRSVDSGRLLRQLGFYLDMLIVLEQGGRAKPNWLPPGEYARQLSIETPAAGAAVAELADLYYAARYGEQRLTHDQTVRARQLIRDLAAHLHVTAR